MDDRELLLHTSGLCRTFNVNGAVLSAVDGVNLSIYRGETLAVVGESGCGKSTLGQTLIGLLPATSGSIFYGETDIAKLHGRALNPYRRRMQMIFQDPFASMNPRMTVGQSVAEPLIVNHLAPNRDERQARVEEMLEQVGIRREFASRYPHQFSGGQRQRIGIARALVMRPELVICDEPVSALDVSIQAQILNLLYEMQQKMQLTYVFISHDLSVVRYISDRTCVMFLGRVCEIGPTEELYTHPRHPYTRFLLNAVPRPDPDERSDDVELLAGEMPSPINPPSGCRFRTRCPRARAVCAQRAPECVREGGREVYCHFPLED